MIPKKGLFDLCEFIDFLRTNLKEKNLEETVESAFRQIEEKKYVTDLVTAGINEERIYKLGFAFAGKEVLVKEKI